MQGRCRRRKLALFGLAILPLLIFASADDAAAGAEAVASAAAQKNDDGENAGQGDTDDSAENSTGGISEDDMDSNPEDEWAALSPLQLVRDPRLSRRRHNSRQLA